MGQVTPTVYQYMVNQFGKERADQWLAEDHNEVPDGFKQQAPTDPSTPAAVEEKPPAPASSSDLSVAGILRNAEAQRQQVAERRKARFEAATADLAKERSGPGLSERLFQLSAALAAPVPVRGGRFNGVMGNVMPVLARQSAAQREGATLDADKLRLLREKYEDAGDEDAEKGISTQLKLAELRDAQQKATQPGYQLNPVTGQLQGVPKQIYQPTTPEEFDAIPRGQYFMVPDGPDKGRIVPKV